MFFVDWLVLFDYFCREVKIMSRNESAKVKQPRITPTVLRAIARWCKQEEETGEYKPFLNALRSGTVGTGHIGYNSSGTHPHQMLSRNEKHLVRVLRFLPNVLSIRLQFPLLPITETMRLAKHSNIRHPAFNKIVNGVSRLHASVMTTDVLIEYLDETGDEKLMALSLKYVEEPSPPIELEQDEIERTQEKLYLEKLYWETLGCEWRLVTRYGPLFNEFFIKNLQEAEDRINLKYDEAIKQRVLVSSLKVLGEYPNIRFQNYRSKVSALSGVRESSVLCIFWQLIWEQKLLVDLTKSIGFNEPLFGGQQWVWS